VFSTLASPAPVTDWRLYDTHYTERYLERRRQCRGLRREQRARVAGNLASPLLVVHAWRRQRAVHALDRLMSEFQKRGVQFDVMVYPGQKHSLTRHADVGPHALHTIARWLEAQLQTPAGH